MDETLLIIALKRGDEKAFDAIFRKYGAELYHFSLNMMHDEAEAQEVLQETFLKVWENRRTIDHERNFRNYLISIAKHLIYNIFRHRLVMRKYEQAGGYPSSDPAGVENDMYLDDLRRSLLTGIDRLSPRQREVLALKSRGMGNEEIAGILNLSKRTVEYHLSQAYRQLRSDLHHLRDVFHLVMPLIYCLL